MAYRPSRPSACLRSISTKTLPRFTTVSPRVKNVERDPTGFGLADAPILGLLVRIWKLIKEVIKYYEQDNAQIIGILERPMIEAAVIATYLMTSSDAVIEDYRKCSYKDRLRILRDLEGGYPFFDTKAGKRLMRAVQEKMQFENLTKNDFKTQKANKWRIQGRLPRYLCGRSSTTIYTLQHTG